MHALPPAGHPPIPASFHPSIYLISQLAVPQAALSSPLARRPLSLSKWNVCLLPPFWVGAAGSQEKTLSWVGALWAGEGDKVPLVNSWSGAASGSRQWSWPGLRGLPGPTPLPSEDTAAHLLHFPLLRDPGQSLHPPMPQFSSLENGVAPQSALGVVG